MSEEEIIEALNEIAARFREQHLCGYEHVVNAVALIVQQQAQIARVREVVEHDGYTVTLPTANWNTQLESMDDPYRAEVVLSADILEALEVPNE